MGDYFDWSDDDTARAIAASVESEELRRREDAELEAALAASLDAGGGEFRNVGLMFLGGSLNVDAGRRARFSGYGCFTAGDHAGADIVGDWSSPEFWAEIRAKSPGVVVLDAGSESWLSTSPGAIEHLLAYISERDVVLLYSPHHSSDALWRLSSRRYNVVMWEGRYLLFAFWAGLPERPGPLPSELVFQIRDCERGEMSASERLRCYGSLRVFEDVGSYEDGVAAHLARLFSGGMVGG